MIERVIRIGLASVLLAGAATAQESAAPSASSLYGIAFDSLGNAPLADAYVIIQGTARATFTDAQGKFAFDSLAAGSYVLLVQHPALDSTGLSGIAGRAVVPGGEAIVATPSFATLWRIACGQRPAPSDSGFVYGTVRDALRHRPVEGATVTLAWLELKQVDSRKVDQRHWTAVAGTDASGTYGICGVPLDASLRVQATTDSLASGVVDVGGQRVRRRDLVIAPFARTESAPTGTLLGVVTDSLGRGIRNARVVTDDAAEARTDEDGQFILRDVPSGTRQVSVLALGHAPAGLAVDVGVGDTAVISARLTSVRLLDVITVMARSTRGRLFMRELEERRRHGWGYVADSSTIANHGSLATVFAMAPSVRIDRQRSTFLVLLPGKIRRAGDSGLCVATVWIDGRRSDHDILNFLRPDDIAAIEVYPRAMLVPVSFMNRNEDCGAVAVWTKRAFY